MDAFGHFERLWNSDNNPYAYLLEVKDSSGKNVYTHPSNQVYPLISIQPKGWSYRPEQSYSTRKWRRISWRTESSNVHKPDLGYVTQSYMPSAWNFRFQLDHFSLRPDTQAGFIHEMMIHLTRGSGGGRPQTWINVPYPDQWGTRAVRMFLDGDVSNTTPEDVDTEHTEYRASVNLVIEGYIPDYDYRFAPALWKIVATGSDPLSPSDISDLFSYTQDLREGQIDNEAFSRREHLPPD
jgi:hypothetical protein